MPRSVEAKNRRPEMISAIAAQFLFEALVWGTVAAFFILVAWQVEPAWFGLALAVPFVLSCILCSCVARGLYHLDRWAYYLAEVYLWTHRPLLFRRFSLYEELYTALRSKQVRTSFGLQ